MQWIGVLMGRRWEAVGKIKLYVSGDIKRKSFKLPFTAAYYDLCKYTDRPREVWMQIIAATTFYFSQSPQYPCL
jgi:hypothetical protein